MNQKYWWAIAAALCAILLPSSAAAQFVPDTDAGESSRGGRDGLKVWVTTNDGAERQGTLVSFSPSRLILRVGASNLTVPFDKVQRIEQPDPLSNGLRNGAIVGVLLSAPAVVATVSSAHGCTGCGAFLVLNVLVQSCVGASIGAWVDHLIVRRHVIYSASGAPPTPAPSLAIGPIASPRGLGVGASIRW